MTDIELVSLLDNPNIIRNRLKIFSTRKNALAFLSIQQEFGSFGLSQKQFAEHLGWTYTRLNEIINMRRGVTADSALAFGEALGMEPELMGMNLNLRWKIELKKYTSLLELMIPQCEILACF